VTVAINGVEDGWTYYPGHFIYDSLGNSTYIPGQGIGDGSDDFNWWGTAAKNFFKNLISKKFYKQEFAQGGCINTFLEAFDSADILGKLNPDPNVAETMINGQAATYAARYAASRALTYPLRSATVRGILQAGETSAAYFGPAYFDVVGSYALYKEGSAARSGACY